MKVTSVTDADGYSDHACGGALLRPNYRSRYRARRLRAAIDHDAKLIADLGSEVRENEKPILADVANDAEMTVVEPVHGASGEQPTTIR